MSPFYLYYGTDQAHLDVILSEGLKVGPEKIWLRVFPENARMDGRIVLRISCNSSGPLAPEQLTTELYEDVPPDRITVMSECAHCKAPVSPEFIICPGCADHLSAQMRKGPDSGRKG